MNEQGSTPVAVQGIPGSFYEEAEEEFYHRHGIETPEWLTMVSSDRTLGTLDNGTATYSILAIENVQGGVVIETVESLAAQHLAKGRLPAGTAVVGTRRCADIYQLQVLEENIQDLKNNLTLFLGVNKWDQ